MHHASARPPESTARRSTAPPGSAAPPDRPTPWAIIVTGSRLAPPPVAFRATREASLVIAADAGLTHAHDAGLDVDLVVGDLDSVGTDALDRAAAAGTTVERHPAAKDATDLELAIRAARRVGARAVTVLDGGGGRHDHLLANALVLAAAEFADLVVDGWVGDARLAVIRSRRTLTGPRGSWCSLLALGGPAVGVTTTGLRFPLRDETLEPGSTRGVSNEFLAPTATVEVTTGIVLAIQPGPEWPDTEMEA